MLRLRRDHSEEIIDHAMSEAEHSRECVGVVVCHVETRECRVIRLDNSARDPENRFEVAEKDVRRLYKELDVRREFIDVVYHSHTRVEAIPSAADVANAEGLEDAHHLIVATAGRGRALRSWRITGGEAREEPITFVPSRSAPNVP